MYRDRKAWDQTSHGAAGTRSGPKNRQGGITLLVALYLPICVIAMGMVFDLGFAFTVRQTAQAACDLGALAGVQELDWDRLAEGAVALNAAAARRQAADITFVNLMSLVSKGLITEPEVTVIVGDRLVGEGLGGNEPFVKVEASLTVKTFFLRWLPGLASGIPLTVQAEARCVQRTVW